MKFNNIFIDSYISLDNANYCNKHYNISTGFIIHNKVVCLRYGATELYIIDSNFCFHDTYPMKHLYKSNSH